MLFKNDPFEINTIHFNSREQIKFAKKRLIKLLFNQNFLANQVLKLYLCVYIMNDKGV